MFTERIALIVTYDGKSYQGWQTQLQHNSIQESLEKSLSKIADHPIYTVCAGRTDAGVHALGQVVHFDTTSVRTLDAWVQGTNHYLPDTISVKSAFRVDHNFHARFKCSSRTYMYSLYQSNVRHPIYDNYAKQHRQPLNIDRMNEACQYLIGKHDFSAWRSAGCQNSSPIKHIFDARCKTNSIFTYFIISASGFLYHMVRNIIGSLYLIGLNKKEPQWLKHLLDQRQRGITCLRLSAQGLFFVQATYKEYPQIMIDNDIPYVHESEFRVSF